jgi:hypothetical protein
MPQRHLQAHLGRPRDLAPYLRVGLAHTTTTYRIAQEPQSSQPMGKLQSLMKHQEQHPRPRLINPCAVHFALQSTPSQALHQQKP